MKKYQFSPIDLLFFNRLVMPSVLTVLYWIALVLTVLGSLITIISGAFFQGLIGLVLGVVFTRLGFEMICVAFSINKNLEKLVDLQSHSNSNSTQPDNIDTK